MPPLVRGTPHDPTRSVGRLVRDQTAEIAFRACGEPIPALAVMLGSGPPFDPIRLHAVPFGKSRTKAWRDSSGGACQLGGWLGPDLAGRTAYRERALCVKLLRTMLSQRSDPIDPDPLLRGRGKTISSDPNNTAVSRLVACRRRVIAVGNHPVTAIHCCAHGTIVNLLLRGFTMG